MKIQILGTGCPKCKALAAATEDAARALGVAYDLEKVTDIQDIMSFNIASTPALVVDGKVVSSGRIPSADELKLFLSAPA